MRLATWALIGLLVAGCGVLGPTVAPAWRLAPKLQTPDGIVGVFRDADGVHLVLGDQDTGGQRDGADGETLPTIHLFSTSGQTGRTYNSFVFGLAPPGATSVKLTTLDGIGGEVEGGLYLIALREKDILPNKLNWAFLSESGLIISEGANVTP